MNLKSRGVIIAIFVLLSPLLFSKTQLIVSLKANCTPKGSILYLKDIAKVYSQYPSVKRKAENILIARGIIPSKIERKDVELKLYGNGFLQFRVVGAPFVNIVKGEKLEVLNSVKLKIQNYIRKKYRFAEKIEIKFQRLPDIYFSKGCSLKVFPVPVSGFLNTQLFKVQSIKGGTILSTGFVQVFIRVYAMIPVAKRFILKGERIKEGDFNYELREINSSNFRFIRNKSSIINKIARVSIREGEVIRKELVISPYLVRRGERVSVFLNYRGIRIRAEGIAIDSGRLGERVRVKNERSGKILFCTVFGKGKVEVSV